MSAGMLGGRYELHTQLGAGGFGSVWRATDTTLLREIAVKLIQLDTDVDTTAREAATLRFRREAQAVAGLNHPNVVAAYDFGIEGNTAYLVMELVNGASLLQMLKQRRAAGQGPFDVATVVRIGVETCAGLGAAHRAGLVHRDLKPANLMIVEPSGQVKIVDFGIARISDRSRITRTGSYMGTLPYIAPEQMGANPLDSRADIYSLGCLLHELLTGRSPYDAESPVQWLSAHQYSPPAPLSAHLPGAPRSLENLILEMLAKDPAARPATTDVVGARLAAISVAPAGSPSPLALPVPGAYPPPGAPGAYLSLPPGTPGAPAPQVYAPQMAMPPMSGPPMSGPPMSGPPMSGPPAWEPTMAARAWEPTVAAPIAGSPMSVPPMSQPPASSPPPYTPPPAPVDQPPLHLPVGGAAPTPQPPQTYQQMPNAQVPQYQTPHGNTPNLPQTPPPGVAAVPPGGGSPPGPPAGPAGPVAYGYDGRPLQGGQPGAPPPKRHTGLIVALVTAIVLVLAGAAVAIGPLGLLSSKNKPGNGQPSNGRTSSAGTGGGNIPCDLKIAFLGTEHSAFGLRDTAEITGMQLALAQYNAQHTSCQVTPVTFDTNPHSAPTVAASTAQAAANQLVADPHVVGVIGPATSTDAAYTMDILNTAGVGEITPSATNDSLTTMGWKVFHRAIGPRVSLFGTIGSYVAGLTGAKVFVVDDGSLYGTDLIKAVKFAASSLIVGSERVAAEDKQTNFSNTVSRINNDGATVVVYGGYSDNAGRLLKQLRASGSNAQFFVGDLADQPAFATLAGSVASSATAFCLCAIPSLSESTFTTAYTAMFNTKPPIYSDVAYDVTNLMITGLTSGAVTRKALAQYISNTTYKGVANTYSFTSTGMLDPAHLIVFRYAIGGASQSPVPVAPTN